MDAQVLDIVKFGKEYLKIVDTAGTILGVEDRDKINDIIEKGNIKMEGLKGREANPEFKFSVDREHLLIDGHITEAFLKLMKFFIGFSARRRFLCGSR